MLNFNPVVFSAAYQKEKENSYINQKSKKLNYYKYEKDEENLF